LKKVKADLFSDVLPVMIIMRSAQNYCGKSSLSTL